MGDVVEHQAGGRDVAQVGVARRVVLEPHVVVLGVVGERDEGVEAAGLVLQRAQAQQVVHLVLRPLDVAVEHGAVALDPHAVGDAVDLDPLVGVQLAVADDLPHFRMEDLGAAAGERAEPRVPQPAQHLLDGELLALGEPADLDGGEGLQVGVGEALLQAAQHLLVPGHGEVGVETADDVELGDAVSPLVRSVGVHLLVGHLPGVGLARQGREAAELAVVGVDADVGGVDVPVDVEVGHVAVDPPPDGVGQLAEVEDMRRGEAGQGVGLVEAEAVAHLGGDILKRRRERLGTDRRGSLGSHREASISRAVAAKSQTESAPLAVKKAALRWDRSPGRTTQCW